MAFLARSFIRKKVSQDRKRFNDGTFDLDLSYITVRIIAMAIPGSGIEVPFFSFLLFVVLRRGREMERRKGERFF